jgi:diaminohydroxyphosphoribosylaminopyrimidine deaminase/5-amino-6-(5-phosphoribosylamino)uracil reductase
MRRALALARRGGVRTRPNPNVGAVVVRDGRVVGEGWHRVYGREHAEVLALREAGARAKGGTLYVTLEPCAHVGHTPPCTDAIVRSGIARCVVATRDPHDIVNGRGMSRLKRAGVKTALGVLAPEARAQLGGYWHAHTRGRPRVTWKVAMTLDGRVADPRGRSRWISGAASRRYAHRLRATSDAIVVGAGTARADDPRLTARIPAARARQPLRVVVDSKLELPLSLKLFGRRLARGTVVACAPGAPARRAARLEARGVTVWRIRGPNGHVAPEALLARLARAGAQEVLLECGPALGTPWLEKGLVDRLAMFVAPRLLGAEGLGWLGSLGPRPLERALSGRFVDEERFGDDRYLLFEVAH